MNKSVRIEWPNGAKIAIVLQVVFEQWEGQKINSSFVPAMPDDYLRQGNRDLLNESFQRYAGRTGIWRLIELLDRHGVTAMGVMSGLSLERYPETVRAFVNGGREICAHSWAQDIRVFRLDKEQERDNIRKCVDIISRVGGRRPVGWVSPGAQHTENTLPLLEEEGFTYHGDYADDDAPYSVEVNGRQMVLMSVPWEVNDSSQYSTAHNPPSAYIELFKRSFDVLYREGGQILGAVAHAPTFGRPFGISAYEEVIRYALSFPDVWITSREKIAEWYLRKYGRTVAQ